ncbi:hypothetical protein BX070DRAFT_228065 [Coemansia spiralis]|nr:hypothetical protein BX070DRAFT_228065 [Coemansia spiralis]
MPAPTDKPADLGDTNADQAAPNDSELANASSDESAISEAGGENSDNAEPSSSSSSGSGASDWVTQMICRVNAVRAQHGVEPLGLSSELDTLAQGQSDYQNSINQMTHSNPAGGIGDRLTKIGITWASAAENVAAGMQTAEDAQQVLENSPGHLANMVDPSMAYFGAARTNNYFTQEFYGASGNTRAQNIPQCN